MKSTVQPPNKSPFSSRSSFIMLLLAVSLFQNEVKTQTCTIQGLSSPGNIFHTYVNFLIKFADLNNQDDKITLVMVNEQNIETIIYRYIFKISNSKTNKTYFIGILSQISSESIASKTFAHSIIRYIQSADIRDAQRLLGIYDATKDDEIDCGNLKQNLFSFFQKNPLDVDSSFFKGGATSADKSGGQVSLDNLASLANSKQNLAGQQSLNSNPNLDLLLKSLANGANNGGGQLNLTELLSKANGNPLLQQNQAAVPPNALLNSLGGDPQMDQSQGGFPLSSQPLLKTRYTLGSVLSGTGRDKIYQRTQGGTPDANAQLGNFGFANQSGAGLAFGRSLQNSKVKRNKRNKNSKNDALNNAQLVKKKDFAFNFAGQEQFSPFKKIKPNSFQLQDSRKNREQHKGGYFKHK